MSIHRCRLQVFSTAIDGSMNEFARGLATSETRLDMNFAPSRLNERLDNVTYVDEEGLLVAAHFGRCPLRISPPLVRENSDF